MALLNVHHLTVRYKNAVPSNCKLKYLEGKKYKTSQIYPEILNKKIVCERQKEGRWTKKWVRENYY